MSSEVRNEGKILKKGQSPIFIKNMQLICQNEALDVSFQKDLSRGVLRILAVPKSSRGTKIPGTLGTGTKIRWTGSPVPCPSLCSTYHLE